MSDFSGSSDSSSLTFWSRVKRLARGSMSNLVEHRFEQAKTFVRFMGYTRDIGAGTFVDRSVQVLGWDSVSIGHSTAVGEGCWFNVNQRIKGHKHIVVGNNCFIGRRNFFSSGLLVELGDYCMTGLDCRFMSADHRFDSPFSPYITTGVTTAKSIRLGVNVWLGVGVSIIGDLTVGSGSIIGAGTLVNKSVPPFSIAFGNPCRVHKRFDFVLDRWVLVEDFDPRHESAMPTDSAYLARLRAQHPAIAMPLLASSRAFGDSF